nr:serine hydrolase domain-containing protein [Melioribacteraceae bacterium]
MKKSITMFILLTSVTFAQITKLDSLLNKVFTQNTLLGFSIAVTKGDSLVYNKGFGLRDFGRNLPIDTNTTYRIASISKTITT